MRSAFCFISLLIFARFSFASSLLEPADPGAYASFTFGNGRISGNDAGDDKLMRWRPFEIRLGHDLPLFGAGTGVATSTLRFDIVHYNEGHPDNNHRDGFAGQLIYSSKLSSALTAEIGTGVYSSMNTTTIRSVQYDSARRGTLSTVALLVTPASMAPAHIRVALNHASMPDTFHSDSLQFGVGRHFTDPPPYASEVQPGERVWLGGAWGRAITNMSGTNWASGGAIQARRDFGDLSASASYLHEGDDGTRVDRQGEALQVWLVQPLVPMVTASFGVGPYFARNRYDDNQFRVHGLFTLHFDYALTGKTKLYYSFSRVKTYAQMNDRDLHHVGVLFALGR
ncbi:hypothetical protein [Rugamonas apoptosis]|uniref:Lipid A deacylase LpxR family protein n=1 Tax=Rugamonas apoptosis TaxID=2758570 RepID=A0A7W2F8X1_9BURK|nr:hypothetical protein [Rugamonas apoptosis]MBA5687237.1 hypothetical protein [Rugamonas apoptosis]